MAGVGDACLRPDGLWDLKDAAGKAFAITHGPDSDFYTHQQLAGYRFREEMADWGYDYGSAGRAPVCVDAAAGTNYGQLVYARASDAKDRSVTATALMQMVMPWIDQRLYVESQWVGTGVLTDYRMSCTAGALSVVSVVLPYTLAQVKDINVMSELKALGLNKPGVQYWVQFDTYSFYTDDAGGARPYSYYSAYSPMDLCVCAGFGSNPNDPTPGLANAVNTVSGMGITYNSDFRVMMHENGHNMGAVSSSAPDYGSGGHCLDGVDIMCGGDAASPGSLRENDCTDADHFDCGHDDYFHPGPPLPTTWLGSHWNVGYQNLFLSYGTGPIQPLKAVDDYYVGTVELGVLNFPVTKNDRDPFLRPLQITAIVSAPGKGVATIAPDGLHVLYDPIDAATGTDAFTYRIQSDIGEMSDAEVTIDLDHYPTPVDQAVTIARGEEVDYAPTFKCDVAPMATDVDWPGDLEIQVLSITTTPDAGSPAAVLTRITTSALCTGSGYYRWDMPPRRYEEALRFGPDFYGKATVNFVVLDHHTRHDGKGIWSNMGGCCKHVTKGGVIQITVLQATVLPGNQPPVSHFTASPMTSRSGEPVKFVDDSYDHDAGDSITAWQWNFGDGTTAGQANPIHIYGAAGTYNVCLVATNNKGVQAQPFCRTLTTLTGSPGTSPAASPSGDDSPAAGPAVEPGPTNQPPGPPMPPSFEVEAGPGGTFAENDAVALHATAAGAASFHWVQTAGPAATLIDPNSATLRFAAPRVDHATQLYFVVEAADASRSAVDGVAVTVRPGPGPTANVAPDAVAAAGATVSLDGSASTSPTGRPLLYAWTQVQGPPVNLSDASAATLNANLLPDAGVTYRFALEVNDGASSSVAIQSFAVPHRALVVGAAPPPVPPAAGAQAAGRAAIAVAATEAAAGANLWPWIGAGAAVAAAAVVVYVWRRRAASHRVA